MMLRPSRPSADPYIRQHQARSILCLPLVNQAKLMGVLYLENNLTPRAFAPARIALLKTLASQAAISLENTRLYRDLEQREAKIRRLVDANIMGIFTWQLDGHSLEGDDACADRCGELRGTWDPRCRFRARSERAQTRGSGAAPERSLFG